MGQNPPVIVIHGTSLSQVSDSYRRYLESQFREQFELTGTPLRVEFRTSRNPYAEWLRRVANACLFLYIESRRFVPTSHGTDRFGRPLVPPPDLNTTSVIQALEQT